MKSHFFQVAAGLFGRVAELEQGGADFKIVGLRNERIGRYEIALFHRGACMSEQLGPLRSGTFTAGGGVLGKVDPETAGGKQYIGCIVRGGRNGCCLETLRDNDPTGEKFRCRFQHDSPFEIQASTRLPVA